MREGETHWAYAALRRLKTCQIRLGGRRAGEDEGETPWAYAAGIPWSWFFCLVTKRSGGNTVMAGAKAGCDVLLNLPRRRVFASSVTCSVTHCSGYLPACLRLCLSTECCCALPCRLCPVLLATTTPVSPMPRPSAHVSWSDGAVAQASLQGLGLMDPSRYVSHFS